MTAIQYFISIVGDVVSHMRSMSLACIGLPNMTLFKTAVVLIIGGCAFNLLPCGGDNDD